MGGDNLADDNQKTQSVINVIDEFDYSTQNDFYSEKFRGWRNRRDNKFAFSFEKNERERVYIDGRGFIDNSRETVEKKVLDHIFYAIGIAFLVGIVFDNVLSKFIIFFMSFLGINIHTTFSSSVIFGGHIEVVLTLILFGILKLAIPAFYLHFKFKVPLRAEIMSNMNDSSALIGAISMAFIVCIAASIPNAYSTESKELVAFFTSNVVDSSIWDQTEFIAYMIYDLLISPIASQLLFCGASFTVLRQFGDPFAIIVTAFSSAILTQDFRVMPAVFLVTIVGCYGMLATGTIFTAIAVNIMYKMYDMTLTLIETDTSDNMPIIRNMFMAVILILGAVGLVYYRIHLKKKGLNLAFYNSEISFRKRIANSIKIFPYSAVVIICVIYATVKAVL